MTLYDRVALDRVGQSRIMECYAGRVRQSWAGYHGMVLGLCIVSIVICCMQ